VGQFAAGAVLVAAFVLVERRAAAPVLDLALFRRSAFTGAALAVFMSSVLSIGGTIYFVEYMQGSLGLGATATGLLQRPGLRPGCSLRLCCGLGWGAGGGIAGASGNGAPSQSPPPRHKAGTREPPGVRTPGSHRSGKPSATAASRLR
jgi:hypothetical protein